MAPLICASSARLHASAGSSSGGVHAFGPMPSASLSAAAGGDSESPSNSSANSGALADRSGMSLLSDFSGACVDEVDATG
eukprot:1875300-Pyramimonas_sp.AAC.1